MVVNTCGWVDGEGYKLLLHAAEALGINVVLVLGHDQLHAQLNRELTHVTIAPIEASASSGSNQVSAPATNLEVDVVKLQRSGSVRGLERGEEYCCTHVHSPGAVCTNVFVLFFHCFVCFVSRWCRGPWKRESRRATTASRSTSTAQTGCCLPHKSPSTLMTSCCAKLEATRFVVVETCDGGGAGNEHTSSLARVCSPELSLSLSLFLSLSLSPSLSLPRSLSLSLSLSRYLSLSLSLCSLPRSHFSLSLCDLWPDR